MTRAGRWFALVFDVVVGSLCASEALGIYGRRRHDPILSRFPLVSPVARKWPAFGIAVLVGLAIHFWWAAFKHWVREVVAVWKGR